MTYRKKLIEVSLPLEAINKESAREKSIRHGHPSTLHLWWARRPLAACRAVLWSSLVDDPSEYMPDEESANQERERLFRILEELVKWENINNQEVLDKAKLEIARSVARDLGCEVPVGREAIHEFLATKAPPVLDPFAGGGSIPLEAQRLGLRTYASDLNPVAVLINKAMIEIPPKFANLPPVHPPQEGQRQDMLLKKEWKEAEGLAEDVRYYGKWMCEEAEKRIGHLYPKVTITQEMLLEREDLRKQGLQTGDELTVIAWLWARTVKCPNPTCGLQMPLLSTLWVSKKRKNEAWIEISKEESEILFSIKTGEGFPEEPPKIGKGAKFRCPVCKEIAPEKYVREQFILKDVNEVMTTIIADGNPGRIYLSPNSFHIECAFKGQPIWKPSFEMDKKNANLVSGRGYGINYWDEIFSQRQLTCLSHLYKMISEVYEDISRIKCPDRDIHDYARAIITYLVFAIDRLTDKSSTLAWWLNSAEKMAPTFTRHALAMVWDYAEVNPFSDKTGNFGDSIEWVAKVIDFLPKSFSSSNVFQKDAQERIDNYHDYIVSTDPPYYDNIAYADLSDYFYIWLRYSIKDYYKKLFDTILVPKSNELVAQANRFKGNRQNAKFFFEKGIQKTFKNLKETCANNFPTTVFYAFKQSEEFHEYNKNIQISSTGWETFLEGLISAGFIITGSWPMRTERGGRIISVGTNALASSIVLVCRPREKEKKVTTRKELILELKEKLPIALKDLQLSSLAPVDLAQAAIGPGMAIFSQYDQVLEANGERMGVRSALSLINQSLDEYFSEQEGDFDSGTRWVLAWFEQYGHEMGPYGVAETLSTAKNTSVERLAEAGFLEARAGKVRLLKRSEFSNAWDPAKDKRLTSWEAAQYLIKALDEDGEKAAGALLAKLGTSGESARDLAYRLYTICERKGWAQDALAYNMLVVTWPRIKEISRSQATEQQKTLL